MDFYIWKHECSEKKFISYVRTLEAVEVTYEERWPIRMDGERDSGTSMLLACLDDDDDNDA